MMEKRADALLTSSSQQEWPIHHTLNSVYIEMCMGDLRDGTEGVTQDASCEPDGSSHLWIRQWDWIRVWPAPELHTLSFLRLKDRSPHLQKWDFRGEGQKTYPLVTSTESDWARTSHFAEIWMHSKVKWAFHSESTGLRTQGPSI